MHKASNWAVRTAAPEKCGTSHVCLTYIRRNSAGSVADKSTACQPACHTACSEMSLCPTGTPASLTWSTRSRRGQCHESACLPWRALQRRQGRVQMAPLLRAEGPRRELQGGCPALQGSLGRASARQACQISSRRHGSALQGLTCSARGSALQAVAHCRPTAQTCKYWFLSQSSIGS